MIALEVVGWIFVAALPLVAAAACIHHDGWVKGHAQGLLDARQEVEE